MSDALIQIVDENNQPVGAATRKEAWAKGLFHRVVFIMVEDQDGRILLQKRSQNMGLYPGRWTVAASGHVDAGEDYDTTAKRELAEEIGIKSAKLQPLGSFFFDGSFEDKKLKRFDKAYKTILPRDAKFSLQADEVTEVRWFTLAEVRNLVQHAEKVTPILAKIIKDYYPA
jgi:16S rRNA (adenine1518-N6/adenine1519-N6)-dimethyltransferase